MSFSVAGCQFDFGSGETGELTVPEPEPPVVDRPEVTRIDPLQGRPGDTVIFEGRHLQGVTVYFRNKIASPAPGTLDTAEQVTRTVPLLEPGDANVVVAGEVIASFTVQEPPEPPVIVRGLSKYHGLVGDAVEVLGENLKEQVLTVEGSPIEPSARQPTRLEFRVPDLEPGSYEVKVAEQPAGTFEVKPFEVLGLYPLADFPGKLVKIGGRALAGREVLLGTHPVEVTSSYEDAIYFRVPDVLATGYQVFVDGVDTGWTFEVLRPPPAPERFEPDRGGTGTKVSIFGNHLVGAEVLFDGVPAVKTYEQEDELRVLVPLNPPGLRTVTVAGEELGTFDVLERAVESFDPGSGLVGSTVTLTGSVMAGATVSFGKTPATTVRENDREVVVLVPDRPIGTVDLLVDDLEQGTFEILGPRLADVCPRSNVAGGALKLVGEGLDEVTEVKFGETVVSASTFTLHTERVTEGGVTRDVQSLAGVVPALDPGKVKISLVGPDGGSPPKDFEVLASEPAGPAQPSIVEYARAVAESYVPPVGREWKNVMDGSNLYKLTADREIACGRTPSQGSVGGFELLGDVENKVRGTYDQAGRTISLTVQRGAAEESYQGVWSDTGRKNQHRLILTSESDCRQLVLSVDLTGICPE